MTANEGTRREKRGRGLSVPMAMRLSDWAVRFLLSAVLAGAELMGGHAPFALALVGVCRPGAEGFAALLGAALGYLSFRGLIAGLRYIAAAMMVYAVTLALGEFELYRRPWFMPGVAAVINGVVGFVYQSAAGWGRGDWVGFATEVVLTAGSVYLFREGFDAWEKRRPGGAFSLTQGAGLLADELHFLSRSSDAAARISHYADLTRYGLTATPVEPAPEPEPEPEPAPPEEPAAVPAVGTVISVSDYSGDPLPNNYTMDQLSLGELETVTPVMGHLNSEYGYRDHPINGRYQFHGGVDIGGQSGDPIGAFAAGTVEYTGEDDSYGLYLQLDHGNGVKSFYAHCSRIVVTKGQVVALGEKVAEIGSSGSATGPHLHLELKYNKMHLNPVYYVDILEQ